MSTLSNPLRRLPELGQSVWYDYIRRDLVRGGELAALIERDDLRGMTTNPSIFAAAVKEGGLYDDTLRRVGPAATPQQAYEALAIEDVRAAAAVFRPVWERTEGLDGYVSIEVSPRLAYDTGATLAEAQRLWQAVDQPNAMIKIPGTAQGLEAVSACIEAGIHVNVTLLFGVPRYREVMAAYTQGLLARAERGLEVSTVRSVASFFVSRVDTMIDDALTAEHAEDAIAGRRGQFGVANARLAYAAFRDTLLQSEAFEALRRQGAHVQRPLWASTSVKNPDYDPLMYVDQLIGPHTVNTIPPDTYAAYREGGAPAVRIEDDLDDVRSVFAELESSTQLRLEAVTQALEEEGVQKFEAAFDALLGTIEARQRTLFG